MYEIKFHKIETFLEDKDKRGIEDLIGTMVQMPHLSFQEVEDITGLDRIEVWELAQLLEAERIIQNDRSYRRGENFFAWVNFRDRSRVERLRQIVSV